MIGFFFAVIAHRPHFHKLNDVTRYLPDVCDVVFFHFSFFVFINYNFNYVLRIVLFYCFYQLARLLVLLC